MHHIDVNERPSIIYCLRVASRYHLLANNSPLHFSLLMLYEQHEHQL